MSLLEFENIGFRDKDKIILDNISVKIEAGDYISIIGPSGSGKSTFLKLCNLLISPSHGNIHYKGNNINSYPVTEVRKNIMYCLQTPYLFGDTVLNNLTFPYIIRNMEIDMNRVENLFSIFKMDLDMINKDILHLSGGEKQRIALIRSLLFKPEILLLDEVTSALDVLNTEIVENVIKKLNNENVTILWVTHNLEQSKKDANKILTIKDGKIASLEVL